MTQNQFVGTWRLVTTEIRDNEGKKCQLYGADATGLLIYTEQGYFSAHLNIPNSPDPATELEVFLGPLSEEQKAYIRQQFPKFNYFSYGGKYEIQPDKVINYGDFTSTPIFSGVQARSFEFTDNRMTLSGPFPLPNKVLRAYLIWERV